VPVPAEVDHGHVGSGCGEVGPAVLGVQERNLLIGACRVEPRRDGGRPAARAVRGPLAPQQPAARVRDPVKEPPGEHPARPIEGPQDLRLRMSAVEQAGQGGGVPPAEDL
jgi:hypothetical protein